MKSLIFSVDFAIDYLQPVRCIFPFNPQLFRASNRPPRGWGAQNTFTYTLPTKSKEAGCWSIIKVTATPLSSVSINRDAAVPYWRVWIPLTFSSRAFQQGSVRRPSCYWYSDLYSRLLLVRWPPSWLGSKSTLALYIGCLEVSYI